MLVIAPLAYATDVDPGWGGFYDDDDGDNVILFITSAIASVDPAPLDAIDPQPVVVGAVADFEPIEPVPASLPRPDSRSPPSL